MSVSQFGGGGAATAGSGVSSGGGNETAATLLVNASSTGDAGNRADHFTGSSLNARWTLGGQALVSSVVGASVFAPVSNSANLSSMLQTYTPTGNFSITSRIRRGMITSSQIALVVGTSTFVSNPLAGDAVVARLIDSSGANGPNRYEIGTVDAGVFTSRFSTVGTTAGDGYHWIYVTLARSGNNWTASFSFDGAGLLQPGTTAKTMTPAVAGFWISQVQAGFSSIDFFDVLT